VLNEAQVSYRNNYATPTPYFELEHSWQNLSGLATGSVHILKDLLAYATYSRGSKSGGLNLTGLSRDLQAAGKGIVKPEVVDHVEGGVKSQWFGHRLTINADVFHTLIRDLQITTNDVNFQPARRYLSNVAAVVSKGVELEVRAVPRPGLSLYATGLYNIVEYSRYKTSPCAPELLAPGEPTVCDLSGRPSAVAPKYSGSAGGNYTLDLTSGLALYLGADVSYRSWFYGSTDASRYSRVPETTLVNARLGVKDRDGRWDLQVWSTNLLNATYWLTRSWDQQTGLFSGQLGEPRMIGTTFRYYFL